MGKIRFLFTVASAGVIALSAVVVAAPSSQAGSVGLETSPRAVMVAGSSKPPSGDRQFAAQVELAGFDLEIVDDDSDLAAIDLSGVDLLLISSSVKPSKVGDAFKDAAVPILVWEPYLYDDLGLTTRQGETRRARTFLTVADSTSVLAAGFGSENVGVYKTSQRFSHGAPGADANTVAHEYRHPERALIFAYDSGDELADGSTSAASRVALFPTYAGAGVLNRNGTAFIDAAILHLTGVGTTVNVVESGYTADATLALDAAGNPVVAYRRTVGAQDLALVHCNDPHCAGDDESIELVDVSGSVGFGASLALDEQGNPVISYFDSTRNTMNVVHCNDPNCAGGDESIQPVVSTSRAITETSLALDADGNPVVTFFDRIPDPDPFVVVHCNDGDCAGGDESIEHIAGPRIGFEATLRIDASGLPVISYFDGETFDLEVVHCNDANCAGADEVPEVVDSIGKVGSDSSMVLNASGNPVISYQDNTRGVIKLATCNDPNCAGADEQFADVDATQNIVWGTSLALTAAGLPVIAHASGPKPDLLVTRCADVACTASTTSTVDDAPRAGVGVSMVVSSVGALVIAYHETNKDFVSTTLKLAHIGPS